MKVNTNEIGGSSRRREGTNDWREVREQDRIIVHLVHTYQHNTPNPQSTRQKSGNSIYVVNNNRLIGSNVVSLVILAYRVYSYNMHSYDYSLIAAVHAMLNPVYNRISHTLHSRINSPLSLPLIPSVFVKQRHHSHTSQFLFSKYTYIHFVGILEGGSSRGPLHDATNRLSMSTDDQRATRSTSSHGTASGWCYHKLTRTHT